MGFGVYSAEFTLKFYGEHLIEIVIVRENFVVCESGEWCWSSFIKKQRSKSCKTVPLSNKTGKPIEDHKNSKPGFEEQKSLFELKEVSSAYEQRSLLTLRQ
jgi:hypothetical protein